MTERLVSRQSGMLFVIALAAATLSVFFTMRLTAEASAESVVPDWPQFEMTWIAPGGAAQVGERSIAPTNEVHKLEYRSENSWTDTIVEAETFSTAWGEFSIVGSWRRVEGDTVTQYDSISGQTTVSKMPAEADVAVAHFALARVSDEVFADARRQFPVSKVDVGINWCRGENCSSVVRGKQMTIDGVEMVFTDDDLGIPLKWGDFEVTSLRVGK